MTPPMTPNPSLVDLAELERIAKAATPGPWTAITLPLRSMIVPVGVPAAVTIADVHQYGSDLGPDHAQRARNALHIATFDPPTVLALIARIQALEAGSGEGWRAMETAPRDGLLRLFWSPLGGCFIAPDIAPSEPTITQKAAMIKAGADWPHVGWNPTAWRPLPAPPSTSAGEGRVAKVAQAFDVGFSLACGLSCGCMDGETPDNYERDEILGIPSPPSGSVGEP